MATRKADETASKTGTKARKTTSKKKAETSKTTKKAGGKAAGTSAARARSKPAKKKTKAAAAPVREIARKKTTKKKMTARKKVVARKTVVKKRASVPAQGPVLRLQYYRSAIGLDSKQKSIVRGLGFGRLNSVRTLIDTPSIRGMVAKVPHLVRILDK